jgi:Tol biopolymer transport system component
VSAREARTEAAGSGGRIAFQSNRGGEWQIYFMNADGSGQRELSSALGSSCPSWSPDGRRIAFHSDRGSNDDIYVMNADGSKQRRLTQSSAEEIFPSWGARHEGRFRLLKLDEVACLYFPCGIM